MLYCTRVRTPDEGPFTVLSQSSMSIMWLLFWGGGGKNRPSLLQAKGYAPTDGRDADRKAGEPRSLWLSTTSLCSLGKKTEPTPYIMNVNESLDLTFPISLSQCTSGFSQLTMSVINAFRASAVHSASSMPHKSRAD